MTNCPDCGVMPGVCHEDGCDVAQVFPEGDDDCECDAWSGRWPGELECEEYGWFTVDEATGYVFYEWWRSTTTSGG